ncbi:MAG: DUF554 domain-containing protein [Treponema sp.]|nr:DUF554 domain-containing protein [Treponema sp.]
MLAVYVNCIAVIVGSILGLLFAKLFTEELSKMITTACGVVTTVLGMQMAFKYQNVVFLTLSLIAGGIIGYVLDIDGAILKLGKLLERLVYRKNNKSAETEAAEAEISETELTKKASGGQNFAFAFLNASILFCVGAMAIVGSFKAGVEKDYSIIFTKSILDGFMAISFAASMGLGTAFSALAILVYQGALTLLSIWLQPYVSEEMIAELTGCGGCMIIMIGLNLIGLTKIKTANFLPALVLTVLFVVGKGLIVG